MDSLDPIDPSRPDKPSEPPPLPMRDLSIDELFEWETQTSRGRVLKIPEHKFKRRATNPPPISGPPSNP